MKKILIFGGIAALIGVMVVLSLRQASRGQRQQHATRSAHRFEHEPVSARKASVVPRDLGVVGERLTGVVELGGEGAEQAGTGNWEQGRGEVPIVVVVVAISNVPHC